MLTGFRRALLSSSAVASVSGAVSLLGSETQGLALDFTDNFFSSTGQYGSAYVLDTGTPANNYNSHPYGLLTYTSPSVKMTRGPSGTYRYGAHNLMLQSEALATSPWGATTAGTGVAATVTNAYADGPVAGMSATRVQMSLGGGTTASDISGRSQTISSLVVGASYTRRVWMRSTDGTSSYVVQLQASDGVASNITVTGTWQQFTVTGVPASTFVSHSIRLRGAASPTNSPTADILVSGDQLYRNPADTTYLATTSAQRFSLPFEWSSAGVLQGILVEESRTNSLLWSHDLTNAAWVKSNGSAAFTATGIDGASNSASTFTASADNGIVYQTLTHASGARSSSAFLKRRTGSGTVSISQGQGNGSELVTNGTFTSGITGWTAYGTSLPTLSHTGSALLITNTGTTADRGAYATITTVVGRLYRISANRTASSGTVNTRLRAGTTIGGFENLSLSGSGVLVAYFIATGTTTYVSLHDTGTDAASTHTWDDVTVQEVAWTTASITSDWARYSIENQTLTNSIFAVRVHTNGDAVDVDMCMNEAGAFVTSPVETFSATATRAADNITALLSLFPSIQLAGTIFAEANNPVIGTANTKRTISVSDTTSNEIIQFASIGGLTTSNMFVNDGGVSQASITGGTLTSGVTFKHGGAYAANDFAHYLNGSSLGTDASGTLPTTTTVYVGSVNNGEHFNGYIRKLMMLPRRMSNSDLGTLTT